MAVPIPALAGGVFLRYVDANNYMRAVLRYTSGASVTYGCEVIKKVAGTDTYLASIFTEATSGSIEITAVAYASGQWFVKLSDGSSQWSRAGYDAALATGGALASGRVGLVDNQPNASASTRTYDGFEAWVPPSDATLFASQSAQVSHEAMIREDAAGTVWATPGEVRGRYLRVPASNVGGTVRVICKDSRNLPGEGADAGIDDLRAELSVTPLYLHPPE